MTRNSFWSWMPSTYGQVWLVALLVWGVPGFVAIAAVGRSLVPALVYAATATLVGGLVGSYQLRRRLSRSK